MKKFLAVLLVLVMVLGMSACGGGNKSAKADNNAADTVKVGFSVSNLAVTYYSLMLDYAKKYAEANNIELITNDAQGDVVKQQNQITSMIDQGVDALLVIAVDSSSMDPVTTMATDAKIPLVYVNVNPYPDKNLPGGVYYVGSEEYKGGYMEGEAMGEALGGKGNVAILQGDLTQESSQKRTQGAVDALKEKYPDIKVIAKEPADWMQDKAMQVAENWITAYGDQINGIISNNDEMAVVAAGAFKKAGLNDVKFIGLDGQEYGLNGVKDGTLIASVLQDCQGQTEGGMKLAADLGAGKQAGEQVVWIPFQLITLENLGEYLK